MSVVVFIFYQFFSATYTHVLLYLCRRGFLSFVRSFRFVVIYYVVEWRRQREAKSKKELCTHSFWHKHKTDHCVRGISNKNKTYMYRWRPQATISRRSMMMHMFTLWRSTGKKKACRKYTSKRNFSSETGSETMFFFVLFALSNGTHIIMVWHYPQTLCVLCVYHRVYCARFFLAIYAGKRLYSQIKFHLAEIIGLACPDRARSCVVYVRKYICQTIN